MVDYDSTLQKFKGKIAILGGVLILIGFLINNDTPVEIGFFLFGFEPVYFNKIMSDEWVQQYPNVNYIFVRSMHYLVGVCFMLAGLAGLLNLVSF